MDCVLICGQGRTLLCFSGSVRSIWRSVIRMKWIYCVINEPRIKGLLASAIVKMDGVGGLAGWRWIFILEGIATVLIALWSCILMPADLSSAAFFSPEEREFARELFIRLGDRALKFDSVSFPCLTRGRLSGSFIYARTDAIGVEVRGWAVSKWISSQGRCRGHHDGNPHFGRRERKFRVARGHQRCASLLFYPRSVISHIMTAVLDIQVWLCGIAAMGTLVSLYSFALFLCVSDARYMCLIG